jgi:hypothetical protein
MVPLDAREESEGAEEVHELMTPRDLRNHVLHAHTQLRVGMGVMALLFPVALWLGGVVLSHTPLQSSMSAYYHTPMRDLFVGCLFAIGGFLYLYKGFSRKENYALNVAGVLAVGVAIFPTYTSVESDRPAYTAPVMHVACAVLFFFALSYVCLTRASDTLHLIGSPRRALLYHYTYKVIGVCMIVLPLGAVALTYWQRHRFDPHRHPAVFALEFVAAWVFGAYWLLKSLEIHSTQADRRTLKHPVPTPDGAGVSEYEMSHR